MKKIILPLGLVVALIVSVFYPSPGIYLKHYYGVEISAFLIFLVSGYIHKFDEVRLSKNLISIVILSGLANLFIMAFLGAFIARIFLSMNFALGLIIISSAPPTLSSGVVITEVAEGNSVLAIILTIVLNILGLFTIPFILKFTVVNLGNISIDPVNLFFKLLFIILLPFVIGRLLKIGSKEVKQEFFIEIIKLIPPLCVVSAVWICMSASSDFLVTLSFKTIIYLTAISVLIHISFLILSYLIAFFTRMSKVDIEAFIFVSSQKTMPLSVLVLVSISSDITQALVSCLIYHFVQILIDSVIASLISKRKRKSAIINV